VLAEAGEEPHGNVHACMLERTETVPSPA
jgi:hypothetical protein